MADDDHDEKMCIHDPFEQRPASQCFICNGGVKAERAAESAKVLRRSKVRK